MSPTTEPATVGAPLAGRTAIVTGAGRGIGAAIAAALDALGGRVALVARSTGQLDTVAATLTNDPVVITADLASTDGPATAVATALDAFGGQLDVLVNNAAALLRKDSVDVTVDEVDLILDANVRSALLTTYAALPPMLAAGRGTIISISSVSGRRGTPRRSLYAASKAALDGMTRSLAMEYGPRGIRANSIAPGVVATEMWREPLGTSGVEEAVTSLIPTRRITAPSEIADVVAFLATDAARGITGETISVDGGMFATANLYPPV